MKKHLLLISPKGNLLMGSRRFFDFMRKSQRMKTYMYFWSGISSGLMDIASISRKEYDVEIIDENFRKIPFNRKYDLVGVTAVTQQANRAYQIATAFRKRNIPVAIGGIHATCMPDEAAKHADFVFVGEAENSWRAFLQDLKNNNAKKIYIQSDYKDVDMRRKLYPSFDLLDSENYKVIWIQTTRGCPYDCEFCAASRIFGRKYKRKDLRQIINEIRIVKKIWKFPYIGFADDNMFVDKNYSESIIKVIGKENINWFAQTDISIGKDVKFLIKMQKAGCRFLFIGFESLKKDNLERSAGKSCKLKMHPLYKEYIENIQKSGIGVFGAFIVGMDYDDASTFKDLEKFILDTKMLGTQITILTPFPGSRLRERFIKEKKILSNNWDYYTGWNAVIRHTKLSSKQLENGVINLYKRIYNRKNTLNKITTYKEMLSKKYASA